MYSQDLASFTSTIHMNKEIEMPEEFKDIFWWAYQKPKDEPRDLGKDIWDIYSQTLEQIKKINSK